MKRFFSLLLAWTLALALLPAGLSETSDTPAEEPTPEIEAEAESETQILPVDYTHLRVANPTPLTGHFFTSLWGASTSDLDVQELLHRYKLVVYDNELGRYRMNHLVVTGAVTQDDEEGNRTYHLALYEDLCYSDGTKITAWDFAFTLLLMIDPAIREAGGIPADESWILGEEEYLSGESKTLRGLRITSDYLLSVTVKAEALPYFYELSRLRISPYPISCIAPNCRVLDDGEGVYLTPGLTGDILRRTVLDSYSGYMTAPRIVSGPYVLADYRDGKAHFLMNPYYKGNQAGETPAIPELTYSGMTGSEIVQALESGELGLVNKVMNIETVQQCIDLMRKYPDRYRMTSYPRTGLTVIRFLPRSFREQEQAVRQAVFWCLDREGIAQAYTGSYGMPVKGLYGIGQWMVRLLSGPASYPIFLNEETATPEEVQEYERQLEQWQNMNMDAIRDYTLDVEEAIRLLEDNGWNLNRLGEPYDSGIRHKRMEDGRLIGLDMKVLIPANMREALETCWLPYMEQAGFGLELIDEEAWDLNEAYRRDSIDQYDMVFVGEDFTDRFRLNGGILRLEQPENTGDLMPLEAVNDRIEGMTLDVYHTDKFDLTSFARKWLDLQIAIAEEVPVIPVYSNIYFDFYERELLDYRVEKYLGWGNAIVAAWLGDPDAADTAEESDDEASLDEPDEEAAENAENP